LTVSLQRCARCRYQAHRRRADQDGIRLADGQQGQQREDRQAQFGEHVPDARQQALAVVQKPGVSNLTGGPSRVMLLGKQRKHDA
jgi:hypothetical protein